MSLVTDGKNSVLTAIIERYSLLKHPFYVEWAAGTLPQAALRLYASEYGNFIKAIGTGWASIGELHIAEIERKHGEIWDRSFACALGQPIRMPVVREVSELLWIGNDLFGSRISALGSLYAFEAQQPQTMSTKLKGLKDHYKQLPVSCAEYFELHLTDYEEISTLEGALVSLPPADHAKATVACAQMCQALYAALSGIYAHQLH